MGVAIMHMKQASYAFGGCWGDEQTQSRHKHSLQGFFHAGPIYHWLEDILLLQLNRESPSAPDFNIDLMKDYYYYIVWTTIEL